MGFFRMDFSSYTGVAKENKGGSPLIGRIYLNIGDQAARLAFLAPRQALGNGLVEVLLDHLSWECGNRGALRFLAEMAEDSSAFESFRSSGFCIYARQQVWKVPFKQVKVENVAGIWRPLREIDNHSVLNLYRAIVPPLVQGAECLDKHPIHGYGYQVKDELVAFVEVISGSNGIYLIPVVHPNLRDSFGLVASMIHNFQQHAGRPIYIAIRDYQSWLNNALVELDGSSGDRTILMVKHLVQRQRVAALNPLRAVLEGHAGETTVHTIQNAKGNGDSSH